jgi:hypothetical protein
MPFVRRKLQLVWACAHSILWFIAFWAQGLAGMSEIAAAAQAPGYRARFTTLFCLVLCSACATQSVHLSDSDRTTLRTQPAIYVLHYQTAAPEILAGGKKPPPAAAEVRKHAAADPAALIGQSFSHLLGKKEKLNNLHVEPQHLPLPVANNARVYQAQYRHGLALELWVDEWHFNPLLADTKTYLMTLNLRTRLARIDDGQVLWSTGRCSVGGNTAGNRDMRLTRTELTSGTRLRKLLAMARDECARQLYRDFSAAENNRK